MARPGIRPKDAALTEGFNQTKAIPKKKRNKLTEAREKLRKEVRETAKLVDEANDDQSSAQMIRDMRYVYKQINGREKLRKLVKKNDTAFVAMVKELMKIEAAIMSAKIKKEGGGDNGNGFFVVLKGFDQTVQLQAMNSAIDIGHLQRALSPDKNLAPMEQAPSSDQPDQLYKGIAEAAINEDES